MYVHVLFLRIYSIIQFFYIYTSLRLSSYPGSSLLVYVPFIYIIKTTWVQFPSFLKKIYHPAAKARKLSPTIPSLNNYSNKKWMAPFKRAHGGYVVLYIVKIDMDKEPLKHGTYSLVVSFTHIQRHRDTQK